MQPPNYKKIIDGTTEWFKDAKCTIRHREDGPAIIRADGTQQWYLNGKYHREDGPAVIYADGTQYWYLNGKSHREDGPAVICPDNIQCWCINGVLHRTDGPAIIWADGSQSWWLNGKPYTNKKKYQKAAKLCNEDMTMLLLRYNFK